METNNRWHNKFDEHVQDFKESSPYLSQGLNTASNLARNAIPQARAGVAMSGIIGAGTQALQDANKNIPPEERIKNSLIRGGANMLANYAGGKIQNAMAGANNTMQAALETAEDMSANKMTGIFSDNPYTEKTDAEKLAEIASENFKTGFEPLSPNTENTQKDVLATSNEDDFLEALRRIYNARKLQY